MDVKVSSKGFVIKGCHWVLQGGFKVEKGEGVGGELGGRGLCGTEIPSRDEGVGGVAVLASSFDPFLAGLSQGIEERRWIWRAGDREGGLQLRR